MDIISSPWFFSMVEKRGNSPKEKLLAVFAISNEWMSAPGIRELFSLEANSATNQNLQHLAQFLTRLAEAAKAANPGVLSNQLTLLLIGAIAEHQRNPQSPVMIEAMDAAKVLVDRACMRKHDKRYFYLGGVAATVLACFIGFKMLVPHSGSSTTIHIVSSSPLITVQSKQLNPDEVEAVLALHDQIVRGECRAPHLAMLPPGQMTAYMNVVDFRKPDDPISDRTNLRAFMTWFNTIHATECYPQHSNDHINTAWVQREKS